MITKHAEEKWQMLFNADIKLVVRNQTAGLPLAAWESNESTYVANGAVTPTHSGASGYGDPRSQWGRYAAALLNT